MVKLTALLMVSMMCFSGAIAGGSNEPAGGNPDSGTCLSYNNFNLVYTYVDKHIKSGHADFYACEGFKLYVTEEQHIRVKRNGLTVAIITPKGLMSLPSTYPENEKAARETNDMFCKLLFLSAGVS
jgi:hypothetical protein